MFIAVDATVQDTAVVTMEDEYRNSVAIYLIMVPFPMILSDPNVDFKVTILLTANNSKMV